MAQAAYVYGVLPGQVEWHGVDVFVGVVEEDDVLGLAEGLAHVLEGQRVAGLHPQGLGMGAHDGHAHAGGADLEVGSVHYLLGLEVHLHLLLGVAVVGEDVDVGDDVVSQLVLEFLHRGLLALDNLAVLSLQLVHGRGSGAAGSLVGGHMDAADRRQLHYRTQGHHHLYRRAVGIGDDAARGVEGVGGVDLRDDQRYVG